MSKMNLSQAAVAMTLLSAIVTEAFVAPSVSSFVPQSMVHGNAVGRNSVTKVQMASAEEEVAALRAAAQKAREEAQRLSKELGKDMDISPTKTAEKAPPKELTGAQVKSLLSSINFESGDATAQAENMKSFVESSDLSLWNAAATSSANTNSPSPLRPFPVSQSFLEQRTGGKITGATLGVGGEDDVSLDDFKYATLAVTLGASVGGVSALAFLPENIGATVCYLMALIPIVWLGIGSSAPGIIAGAIAATRGTADDQEEREDRICRHEAGHFLCGYLCGLPVKNYSITETGFPCVEFHPSADGDVRREFTSEEISALSVVAMSGSVAEALALGQAKGGESDLLELDNLMRRSADFVGAAKQQDLTRWGALAAYNLITANQDKYEKLVSAFKEKKSVAECIAAIESA